MYRLKTSIAAMLLLGLIAGNSARAAVSIDNGDRVKFLGRPSPAGTTNGGAFEFELIDDGAGNTTATGVTKFITFCAELGETISGGGTYYVKTDPDETSSGGLVSVYNKWTFNEYLTNKAGLIAASSSGTDPTVQNSIQIGLWKDTGAMSGPGSGGVNATEWGQYLADRALWAPLVGSFTGSGIGVAQLFTSFNSTTGVFSGSAQDQVFLYEEEKDTGDVPEPASIAVWSALSLIGVAVGRRRRRR